MYLLGILVSYEELPANRDNVAVYSNLWFELFLDVYFVCLLLTIIPRKARHWIAFFFRISGVCSESCRLVLLGEISIYAQSFDVAIGCRNQ